MARVCEEECVRHSPRDEPLILTNATVLGWHNYMRPFKEEKVFSFPFFKLCFPSNVAHFVA